MEPLHNEELALSRLAYDVPREEYTVCHKASRYLCVYSEVKLSRTHLSLLDVGLVGLGATW